MGVKGLLPVLQSITHPTPLERYEGLSVAVDAMSWLHKGVYGGDVRSLAMSQIDNSYKNNQDTSSGGGVMRKINFESYASKGKNKKSDDDIGEKAQKSISNCISYVTKRVQILQNDYKMDVVLVIDGSALPIKEEENTKRRSERHTAYQEAHKAESNGDTRTARQLYARACSVTQEMKYELLLACQLKNIPFLVAPYEADAQMARLAHSGTVDLVITEDSDLLAYGCPRVLFKIDFNSKRGEEIQIMRDLAMNEPLSFKNWTHDMFVYMCILSGCDYCQGVRGIGVKGAYKLVRLNRSPSKIFAALQKSGKLAADDCLKYSFWKAFRTFRHQRVYCSEKAVVEPLFPVDELLVPNYDDNIWPYLGPWLEPDIAKGVALGELHPDKRVPWERVYKRQKILDCPSQSSQPPPPVPTCGNVSHHTLGNQSKNEAELFSFFPSKKKHRKNLDDCPSPSLNAFLPPLQEIYIDDSHKNIQISLEEDQSDYGCLQPIKENNKKKHQPVPIHFNDYNSTLVGSSFETLSRRNKKTSNKKDRNFNVTQVARRLLRGKAKPENKINNENHLLLASAPINYVNINDQIDTTERLSSCPNSKTYNNDKNASKPRCHSSPNFNRKSNTGAVLPEKAIFEHYDEGNIYDVKKSTYQMDTTKRLSSCPDSKKYIEGNNTSKSRCHSSPNFNSKSNTGAMLPEKAIFEHYDVKESTYQMDTTKRLSSCPDSKKYIEGNNTSKSRCHSSPNFNSKSNTGAMLPEKAIFEHYDVKESTYQMDTTKRLSSCPYSKKYIEGNNTSKSRCHSSPNFNTNSNYDIMLPEKAIFEHYEGNIWDVNEATPLSIKPDNDCAQQMPSILDARPDNHYNRNTDMYQLDIQQETQDTKLLLDKGEIDDKWSRVVQNQKEEVVTFPFGANSESDAEFSFFVNQRDIESNQTRSPCSKKQNYDNFDFKYSDDVTFNNKSDEIFMSRKPDKSKFKSQLQENIDEYIRCNDFYVAEGKSSFDRFSSDDFQCRKKCDRSKFNFQIEEDIDQYQQCTDLYIAEDRSSFDKFSSDDFIDFDTISLSNNPRSNFKKKENIKYSCFQNEGTSQHTINRLDYREDDHKWHADLPIYNTGPDKIKQNVEIFQSNFDYDLPTHSSKAKENIPLAEFECLHNQKYEFSACFESSKKVRKYEDGLNSWEQMTNNYGSDIIATKSPNILKCRRDASVLSAVKKITNL